ncbi:hypothetical protein EOM09_00975 [bacterium]|nr:hypothetical protein [bacterium]
MSAINSKVKLYNNIFKRKDPLFNTSVKKQRRFINKLSLPVTDIDRSYNQYLCQKQCNPFFINLFTNIGSFPLYFYFLYLKKNDSLRDKKFVSALFLSPIENIKNLPSSLLKEYINLEQEEISGFYLTKSDKKFIKSISKYHKFSYFFLLKCILKISVYRSKIMAFNPNAIIVTSEYSFTSSILTLFCNTNNIEHINIMHGEKLLYIRDSWFHFNRCYVWDDYFINLFNINKIFCDEYIIEIPDSQKKWHIENVNIEFDFTYYLQNQTRKELMLISDIMKNLKKQGYRVSVRPHPVYSDLKIINKLFKGIHIEKKSLIIEHSILRTKAVISLFSTVNRQAYNNNVEYIIDDISNKKKYNQLKDLKYYFIEKNHKVLSLYIKN